MSEKEIPLMDSQKPAALSIGYRLELTAFRNLIGTSCRFGFFTLFVMNLHFSGALFKATEPSKPKSPVKHNLVELYV